MISSIAERALLTGLDGTMMQALDEHHLLHPKVLPAFQALSAAMAEEGIELRVASAWRSFERQAKIWQAKSDGLRPVYNRAQEMIDISTLQGLAKLEAIMLYSALPGASRHHWGTELDVYDAAAVPPHYQLQLQSTEYAAGGPFNKLALWLTQHAADFGFFLPYRTYQGGVAAEPWHISYRPVASQYQAAFTLEMLRQTLNQHAIAEQQSVLQHLPTLFQRYITNICET